jgi:guanylate kinase
MNKFNEEISHWSEYNYIVVNDDLESCYNKILNIIISEKKGISKKQDLDKIKKQVDELIK